MKEHYDALPKEDREDWVSSPTTKAFLETIREHRDMLADRVVLSVKGRDLNMMDLSLLGGELAALDFTLSLATRGLK